MDFLPFTLDADAAGGRGGRAGLIDSLPSAIDVSGLGSIGGFGAAASGGPKAGGGGARALDKPPLQPIQKGGLLGMLEQHHAATAQQQQWAHSNSNSQQEWERGDVSRSDGASKLGDLLLMGPRSAREASGGVEGGAGAASGGGSFGGRGLSSGRVGGSGTSLGRSGGLLDWQTLRAMPPVKGPAQRAHIAPVYEDPSTGRDYKVDLPAAGGFLSAPYGAAFPMPVRVRVCACREVLAQTRNF
eukprot:1160535-Pelagomonas_calceolata.AAC.12